MNPAASFGWRPQWHTHLLALSGGIGIASLAVVSHDPNQVMSGIPEVLIPLGIAAAVGFFSIKLHRYGYKSTFGKEIAKWSWAGGLLASAVGGWWAVLHYYSEMPLVGLPEQILTLVSGGVGVGFIVAYSRTHTTPEMPDDAADRVLSQSTWTHRTGDEPILGAIVDVLVDLEQKDVDEFGTLYDQIDPEIFTDLRKRGSSPWQLRFYTDDYGIEVSSAGTVTIYDVETSLTRTDLVISRHDDNDHTRWS